MVLKVYNLQDSEDKKQKINNEIDMQMMAVQNSKNIIQIRGKTFTESKDEFGFNNIRCCILMEDIEDCLETIFQEKVERNKKFEFKELKNLLETIVKTCSQLEENNISHRNLNMQGIFKMSDGTYKLADFSQAINTIGQLEKSEIKPLKSTYENMFNETKTYIDPELQQNLMEGKEEAGINFFKSDIYSLGMIILELSTLSQINKKLNYQEQQIQIITRLNEIEQNYGKGLSNILEYMLHPQHKQRPSFVDLEYLINPVGTENSLSFQQSNSQSNQNNNQNPKNIMDIRNLQLSQENKWVYELKEQLKISNLTQTQNNNYTVQHLSSIGETSYEQSENQPYSKNQSYNSDVMSQKTKNFKSSEKKKFTEIKNQDSSNQNRQIAPLNSLNQDDTDSMSIRDDFTSQSKDYQQFRNNNINNNHDNIDSVDEQEEEEKTDSINDREQITRLTQLGLSIVSSELIPNNNNNNNNFIIQESEVIKTNQKFYPNQDQIDSNMKELDEQLGDMSTSKLMDRNIIRLDSQPMVVSYENQLQEKMDNENSQNRIIQQNQIIQQQQQQLYSQSLNNGQLSSQDIMDAISCESYSVQLQNQQYIMKYFGKNLHDNYQDIPKEIGSLLNKETNTKSNLNFQKDLQKFQKQAFHESSREKILLSNELEKKANEILIGEINVEENQTSYVTTYSKLMKESKQLKNITQTSLGNLKINYKNQLGKGSEGIVYECSTNQKKYLACKIMKSISNAKIFEVLFQMNFFNGYKCEQILKLEEYCVEKENEFNSNLYLLTKRKKWDLQTAMRCEQINMKDKIFIARQLVSAIFDIQYEYQAVVHGDIKPSNILLDNKYNVFITDFGVSHVFINNQKLVESSGFTVMYSPPEQILYNKIEWQTDIWSLGIVFFELFFGVYIDNKISEKLYDEQLQTSLIVPQELIKTRIQEKIAGIISTMTQFISDRRPNPGQINVMLGEVYLMIENPVLYAKDNSTGFYNQFQPNNRQNNITNNNFLNTNQQNKGNNNFNNNNNTFYNNAITRKKSKNKIQGVNNNNIKSKKKNLEIIGQKVSSVNKNYNANIVNCRQNRNYSTQIQNQKDNQNQIKQQQQQQQQQSIQQQQQQSSSEQSQYITIYQNQNNSRPKSQLQDRYNTTKKNINNNIQHHKSEGGLQTDNKKPQNSNKK